MDRAQREMETNSLSEEASNHASLATVNFWKAVRVEEAAMRQKSRTRWLKLDDQNTAFFHRSVRSRQSSNALRSVIDPDGNRLTNHDQVTQVVVNYFKDSLGSQNISYGELSTSIEEIVQFRWIEECC